LIVHTCGVTDDGIYVADVWDGIETLDRFANDRLGAALREAGMPDARPHVSRVHNFFFGAGTGANVLLVIEAPGFTTEVYDGIVSQMPAHVGSGENHPAVSHAAAVEESGEMRIVDVWDSPASFGEFARTQLATAAGDGMPEFLPRFIPIYRVLRPAV